MDIRSYLTIALFVILTLFIKACRSLSCYQCDSIKDLDCMQDFPHNADTNQRSTACDVDGATYCVKTTGLWGGVPRTTRYCSSRDMGDQCEYVTYPDHDRPYRACIFTCSRNHCNSGESIKASFFGVVAALSITLRLSL